MKLFFALLVAVFLIAPVVSHAQTTPATTSPQKIMLIGDSIFQGIYRYYLWQDLTTAGYKFDFVGGRKVLCCGIPGNSDIDVDAHGGFTSAEIVSGATERDDATYQPRTYAGIATSANTHRPDIAVIQIGTNDTGALSPDTTKNNIQQIITSLRAANPNVKVLLALIIPMRNDFHRASLVDPLNQKIAELSSLSTAASPVIIVDLNSGFSQSFFPANDQVHPNNAGHAEIARRLYAKLSLILSGATPNSDTPGLSGTPMPTRNPQESGFNLTNMVPCEDVVPNASNPLTQEFHPLRPYPGSPCDPQIPKNEETGFVSFACGKSLNVEAEATFSNTQPISSLGSWPASIEAAAASGQPYVCPDDSSMVCRAKKLVFDVTINLSNASLPVLGNTEDPNLDDATKANQYLAWYLAGTVQSTEQKPINPENPLDLKRLLNFSGPLRKLLPFDLANETRSEVAKNPGTEFHNYRVGCKDGLSLQYFIDAIQAFFTAGQADKVLSPLMFGKLIEIVTQLADLVFDQPEVAQQLGEALISLTEYDAASAALHLAQVAPSVPTDLIQDVADLTSYFKAYMKELGVFLRAVSLDNATTCTQAGADTKRLSDVAANLPPDPKSSEYANSFDKYWDAYVDWSGRTNVPLAGPLNLTNVWEQLFQNVPFASLEDTVGETTISVIAEGQPEGVENLSLVIKPQTDSRLYFPHLRITNALSDLLASFFRPKSSGAIDPTTTGFVSQSVTQHQGVNDETLVVSDVDSSQPDNNSSVIPGLPAPTPLFAYPGYDQRCDLKGIRINPGDKLYGKTISATLTYYQQFRYPPVQQSIPNPGGKLAFEKCNQASECASLQCVEWPDRTDRICAPLPESEVTLPTEAHVAVFTKSPWLDRLYDTLVYSNNSILRRFLKAASCMPFNCSAEDKKRYLLPGPETIPGASTTAGYDATLVSGDVTNARATAGDGSGGGEIYFARLGSVFDYILGGAANTTQNLQALLRPKDVQSIPTTNSAYGTCEDVAQPVTTSCTAPGTSRGINSNCMANTPLRDIIVAAGNYAQIPPDILMAVLSIESRNDVFTLPASEISKHAAPQSNPDYARYQCVPNSCGAMGPMQILTGRGVTEECPAAEAAAKINNWATYGSAAVEACQAPSGYAPNPGNIRDSIFAGAKMIAAIAGNTSAVWDQQTVYKVARGYYGSCSDTYSLGDFMDRANSCVIGTIPTFSSNMSYCEYLWNYYKVRNPSAPSNAATTSPVPSGPVPE